VLRGLTVALMILVNNAGDGDTSFMELRHSVWNGCTLADIVFPLFLFIVGGSIAIALPRRLASGASNSSILWQVFKRTAWIAALGLSLNVLPALRLGDLRYYGVLQRIALCYFAASLVFLYGRVRRCVVVCLLALFGYWVILRFIPVPGYGLPTVNIPLLDPHGNLTAWLDRAVVPAAHLYRHSFYDPEGLLSTLPAVATTLLGLLSVTWLRATGGGNLRAMALVLVGLIFIACGLLWSRYFPLNKRLWTSSFVIFNAGLDIVLLVGLHRLIDGKIIKPNRTLLERCLVPWLAFGGNALTAYVFSEVLAVVLAAITLPGGLRLQRWLYLLLPLKLGPPAVVSLVYSILFVAVCFLPVYLLYRRKIFIKL
jgi:predicted acyltransferase